MEPLEARQAAGRQRTDEGIPLRQNLLTPARKQHPGGKQDGIGTAIEIIGHAGENIVPQNNIGVYDHMVLRIEMRKHRVMPRPEAEVLFVDKKVQERIFLRRKAFLQGRERIVCGRVIDDIYFQIFRAAHFKNARKGVARFFPIIIGDDAERYPFTHMFTTAYRLVRTLGVQG